jgi:hypothetical protein
LHSQNRKKNTAPTVWEEDVVTVPPADKKRDTLILGEPDSAITNPGNAKSAGEKGLFPTT